MRLIPLLLSVGFVVFSGCYSDYELDKSGQNDWKYGCSDGQSMTWSFIGTGKGAYSFSDGSILKPLDLREQDHAFVRQDGTIFVVQRSASSWVFYDLSNHQKNICRRELVVGTENEPISYGAPIL